MYVTCLALKGRTDFTTERYRTRSTRRASVQDRPGRHLPRSPDRRETRSLDLHGQSSPPPLSTGLDRSVAVRQASVAFESATPEFLVTRKRTLATHPPTLGNVFSNWSAIHPVARLSVARLSGEGLRLSFRRRPIAARITGRRDRMDACSSRTTSTGKLGESFWVST